MDSKELLKRVREDKVSFISYQFTDINGVVKSLDGPVGRLEEVLDSGIWFDGSSVEGFARIQESDMHLRVDPNTYTILPWSDPEYRRARVLCDIFRPNGQPFEGDPRGRLKAALKRSKRNAAGLTILVRSLSFTSFCGMVLKRPTRCRMMWAVILIFQQMTRL